MQIVKRRRRDLSKMEILAALLSIGFSLFSEKLARKRKDFRHTCHVFRNLQNQDGAFLKIEVFWNIPKLMQTADFIFYIAIRKLFLNL